MSCEVDSERGESEDTPFATFRRQVNKIRSLIDNKMIAWLLCLILVSEAGPVKSQYQQQQLIILAGQSNMAGRGGVTNNTKTNTITWDGLVPPQCQPNPSILRLDAKLKWVLAHEPLHVDIDANKTNGVGPGLPFANAVLTKVPSFGVIGLVPCAIGGTNISEWRRGSSLYEQMIQRAEVALQSGGTIRAVLWYQGESDTANLEDAKQYKERSDMFFTDLRSDLQSPLLPIIQVALASGEGPFVEIVRKAQLSTDLPNVRCVDAMGLPLGPDGLHLTTPAEVRLGEMMADAFLHSIPSPIKTTSHSHSHAPPKFPHFISYFLTLPLLTSLLNEFNLQILTIFR